jgi:chromosome segregation ATPase
LQARIAEIPGKKGTSALSSNGAAVVKLIEALHAQGQKLDLLGVQLDQVEERVGEQHAKNRQAVQDARQTLQHAVDEAGRIDATIRQMTEVLKSRLTAVKKMDSATNRMALQEAQATAQAETGTLRAEADRQARALTSQIKAWDALIDRLDPSGDADSLRNTLTTTREKAARLQELFARLHADGITAWPKGL